LDHDATQHDKIRRAPGPGPTYVTADLGSDSAVEALQRRGFDTTQPAVFVLEGVTMYLPEEVVRRQLVGLAEASASGSRLTTDFYPPAEVGTTADQRQHRMQRLARAGSGETLRLLVDRSAAVRLVESSGWVVDDVLGGREAARVFVTPASRLPVDAVNDEKTAVSATLP
jgi:methyltransferase (TIGR00027 family)